MFCRAGGAAVPHSARVDKGLGANTLISLALRCPPQDDGNIVPNQQGCKGMIWLTRDIRITTMHRL